MFTFARMRTWGGAFRGSLLFVLIFLGALVLYLWVRPPLRPDGRDPVPPEKFGLPPSAHEVVSMRTEGSYTFALDVGSRKTFAYAGPENYLTPDNLWAPIKLTWENSSIETAPYILRLVFHDGVGWVRFEQRVTGAWHEFELGGDAHITPEGTLAYKKDGIDCEYRPRKSSVKLVCTIPQKVGSKNWSFEYRGSGLDTNSRGDLEAGSGWRFTHPVVYDSTGKIYETGGWVHSGSTVTVSFDDSVIPEANLPYFFDPTYIGFSGDGQITGKAATFSEAMETANGFTPGIEYMRAGIEHDSGATNEYVVMRAYTAFDTSAIPTSATITQNDLYLWLDYWGSVSSGAVKLFFAKNDCWAPELASDDTDREHDYDCAKSVPVDIFWGERGVYGGNQAHPQTGTLPVDFIEKAGTTYIVLAIEQDIQNVEPPDGDRPTAKLAAEERVDNDYPQMEILWYVDATPTSTATNTPTPTALPECDPEDTVHIVDASAGLCSNIASGGNIDWVNPANAAGATDGIYSTIPEDLGGLTGTSDYLRCSQYGFNIPSDAHQIVPYLNVQWCTNVCTVGGDAGPIADQIVLFAHDETTGFGSNMGEKYLCTAPDRSDCIPGEPTTSVYFPHGHLWTPADINDSTFGTLVAVEKLAEPDSAVGFDSTKIYVRYCQPQPTATSVPATPTATPTVTPTVTETSTPKDTPTRTATPTEMPACNPGDDERYAEADATSCYSETLDAGPFVWNSPEHATGGVDSVYSTIAEDTGTIDRTQRLHCEGYGLMIPDSAYNIVPRLEVFWCSNTCLSLNDRGPIHEKAVYLGSDTDYALTPNLADPPIFPCEDTVAYSDCLPGGPVVNDFYSQGHVWSVAEVNSSHFSAGVELEKIALTGSSAGIDSMKMHVRYCVPPSTPSPTDTPEETPTGSATATPTRTPLPVYTPYPTCPEGEFRTETKQAVNCRMMLGSPYIAWTNPEDAEGGEDWNYAYVASDEPDGASVELNCTDFDFHIPETAYYIQPLVDVSASSGTGGSAQAWAFDYGLMFTTDAGGGFVHIEPDLANPPHFSCDGAADGNFSNCLPAVTSRLRYFSRGHEWTPEEINASGFGIGYNTYHEGPTSQSNVDFVEIRVDYCVPPTPSPTPTATFTITPTFTPTPTITHWPTHTPYPTWTPEPECPEGGSYFLKEYTYECFQDNQIGESEWVDLQNGRWGYNGEYVSTGPSSDEHTGLLSCRFHPTDLPYSADMRIRSWTCSMPVCTDDCVGMNENPATDINMLFRGGGGSMSSAYNRRQYPCVEPDLSDCIPGQATEITYITDTMTAADLFGDSLACRIQYTKGSHTKLNVDGMYLEVEYCAQTRTPTPVPPTSTPTNPQATSTPTFTPTPPPTCHPNGAFRKNYAPQFCGEEYVTTTSWDDPDYARVWGDDMWARTTFAGENQYTHGLFCADYGINLPPDAYGIVPTLGINYCAGCFDSQVYATDRMVSYGHKLDDNTFSPIGKIQGALFPCTNPDLSDCIPYTKDQYGMHQYIGGRGSYWTPSLVNDSSFGAHILAYGSNAAFEVDGIMLTLDYCAATFTPTVAPTLTPTPTPIPVCEVGGEYQQVHFSDTCVNEASANPEWENPGSGASTVDGGASATYERVDAGYSPLLLCDATDFNLPPSAYGIRPYINIYGCSGDCAGNGSKVSDSTVLYYHRESGNVSLYGHNVGGQFPCNELDGSDCFPGLKENTVKYEGDAGVDWSVDNINDSTFGAGLSVSLSEAGKMSVDGMWIGVKFCAQTRTPTLSPTETYTPTEIPTFTPVPSTPTQTQPPPGTPTSTPVDTETATPTGTATAPPTLTPTRVPTPSCSLAETYSDYYYAHSCLTSSGEGAWVDASKAEGFQDHQYTRVGPSAQVGETQHLWCTHYGIDLPDNARVKTISVGVDGCSGDCDGITRQVGDSQVQLFLGGIGLIGSNMADSPKYPCIVGDGSDCIPGNSVTLAYTYQDAPISLDTLENPNFGVDVRWDRKEQVGANIDNVVLFVKYCGDARTATPTQTETPPGQPTSTPTMIPTATGTPPPGSTPTFTQVPLPTLTVTPSPTQTKTVPPESTPTQTRTPTPLPNNYCCYCGEDNNCHDPAENDGRCIEPCIPIHDAVCQPVPLSRVQPRSNSIQLGSLSIDGYIYANDDGHVISGDDSAFRAYTGLRHTDFDTGLTYRGFIAFNTYGTMDRPINSVKIKIRVRDVHVEDNPYTVYVVECGDWQTPLMDHAEPNFQSCGQANSMFPIAHIDTNTQPGTWFTSEPLTISYMHPLGNTYYCLRSSDDLDGSQPLGLDYISFYTADSEGHGPIMLITYQGNETPTPYPTGVPTLTPSSTPTIFVPAPTETPPPGATPTPRMRCARYTRTPTVTPGPTDTPTPLPDTYCCDCGTEQDCYSPDEHGGWCEAPCTPIADSHCAELGDPNYD